MPDAQLQRKKLDQLIIDEVLKLAYDDKGVKALIKPRKQVNHTKAIKALKNQKSRLIDLYSVGGIELDELQIKIAIINEKLTKMENDKPVLPELSFEDALKFFNNAKDILNQDDNIPQKRAILQSLIKKIVLSGNEVQIHWRFE